MEKIKLIADTASDIPNALLEQYGIDMPSVPIVVDGKEYFECKSFTTDEFYGMLDAARETPTTSRVPVEDYLACYERALDEGYTHILSVTINAGGSGTHTSALMAKETLFRKRPDAAEKIEVHVIDSRTYSMAYGYAVAEAARMARAGSSCAEIRAWLDDWIDTAEIYLACFGLEYAKKSGRIGAAAAFVGDVLGLRPIILMAQGKTKIIEKVRGDKNLPARLLAAYNENCTDRNAPVVIVRGSLDAPTGELQALLEKETGRAVPVYMAGASIIINSGPKMLAFVCRGKSARAALKK